jgi:hypothetical protein
MTSISTNFLTRFGLVIEEAKATQCSATVKQATVAHEGNILPQG